MPLTGMPGSGPPEMADSIGRVCTAFVGLVIGGVGYGVYWLAKRRRMKTEV